jgi:acyl-CoA hydrolase
VDLALAAVGKEIVLGMPLGLGKPNQLANAFYRRAKADPTIRLRILTSLSLEKPRPKNETEARFMVPFVERLFGNYEELDYMKDLRADAVPENITLTEFYFKAGAMKNIASAQQNYISSNYTFIARDLMLNGCNVVAQMVSAREVDGQTRLSLSCNTDVVLDLKPMIEQARQDGKKILTIAQVHDDLPFMYNRADVAPEYFDVVVRNPHYNTTLFAPPNLSVTSTDFAMGLHASSLIRDGGTLQIGIGSLGDAIVYACKLRHEQNLAYQNVLANLGADLDLVQAVGGTDTFDQGLYGSSEMFVNGFMHLIKAGIVKRKVYDDLPLQLLLNAERIGEVISPDTLSALLQAGAIASPLRACDVVYLTRWGILRVGVDLQDNQLVLGELRCPADLSDPAALQPMLGQHLVGGIYMHGAFFLGPNDFYQSLRELSPAQHAAICMSSVGHVNQLDHDRPLLAAQRQHARFINTGMMISLSGNVTSDGLEDGTVISGVGGQYNFVAMAHALADGRSILCIRSTRGSGKSIRSNIVTHYGHVTIPRHLRDIVVTEYGVADLRGKSDQDVGIALIQIADSRFQDELIAAMKQCGKLHRHYTLPDRYRHNLPDVLHEKLNRWRAQGLFPAFPLGTDFTGEELMLGKTLKDIKALMDNPKQMIKALLRSFIQRVDEESARPFLERLSLTHPETTREKILQQLLLLELEENGYLKPM